MRLPAHILCGAALVSVAGAALAGEDSTHRLHGVGPAWYEIKDGLRRLAADAPGEPAPAGGVLKRADKAGKTTFAVTGVTNK